ncbi:MAG: hypothetical protein HDR95_08525 [Bacteroides sp.]|nr:hypothetical protein [Bacteroides sp.]
MIYQKDVYNEEDLKRHLNYDLKQLRRSPDDVVEDTTGGVFEEAYDSVVTVEDYAY